MTNTVVKNPFCLKKYFCLKWLNCERLKTLISNLNKMKIMFLYSQHFFFLCFLESSRLEIILYTVYTCTWACNKCLLCTYQMLSLLFFFKGKELLQSLLSWHMFLCFSLFVSRYTSEELNNFPLGTVMEMPKPPLPPEPYVPPQQADSEESDDISLPVGWISIFFL